MTGDEIKEQIYDAMFFRHELRDAICDMIDENEKLRELCEDMYGYARTMGYDHPLLGELGIIDSV